ncbi:unnamed protein product [Rotaria sp. Silwood2]|nr:unnamed protein product [Rotaria sp. Silwood2]CAF3005436.1 unnamed protein product [Rotaria sp. Silwood2]CAF3852928.1 unnamed protein product [Rotaria sp. Silwood2]CAF4008112.1 unnamed protein product [Rotaria sp. Silwood2]CAF4463306.1 unnamed protein product [Rotaria sp. Silwood2]
MHSRAYLLIKRDLYLLDNNPVDGIDIEPIVDDNFFDLTLFLRPGKSSQWSGSMFRIFCSFYDTFNVQPPILQFDPMHIPYHPNVDPITGRVGLSTSDTWSSRFTLRSLFDELANVFITPNQKTVINSDAMRMLKYRPTDYQAIIHDSIVKSQQLMDLINEEKTNTNQKQILLSKGKDGYRARLRTPGPGARRQRNNLSLNQRISFEDYLNTWKGIATSKANSHEENSLLNYLSLQPKLQAQHLALNPDELARQLDDRALQFERLKYGKLTNDEHRRKLAQVSQMSLAENNQRALVVTEANSRVDITTNYENTIRQIQERDLIKNDEVDELIVWTQGLPDTDETVTEN